MKTEGKSVLEPAEDNLVWEKHLKKWQVSGLSKAGYCRKFGLKSHNFHYWCKKLAPSPGSRLLKVPMSAISPILTEKESAAEPLVIVFVGDIRLKVSPNIEPTQLRRIVSSLRGV